MKTVVVGEPPVEITAFLTRRRALGQDGFDEVWEGDYHVVPAPHPWHGYVESELAALLRAAAQAAGLSVTGQFNLGEQNDYRVPDGGYHRGVPSEVFVPTTAIVVEIVSPHDETWLKFDFYARRPQVQENLTTSIADEICRVLSPRGALVVIEAEHMCMTMRGVRKPGMTAVTSAVRGLFRDNAATRAEAMAFIHGIR